VGFKDLIYFFITRVDIVATEGRKANKAGIEALVHHPFLMYI
jgi:hypothetical protein